MTCPEGLSAALQAGGWALIGLAGLFLMVGMCMGALLNAPGSDR